MCARTILGRAPGYSEAGIAAMDPRIELYNPMSERYNRHGCLHNRPPSRSHIGIPRPPTRSFTSDMMGQDDWKVAKPNEHITNKGCVSDNFCLFSFVIRHYLLFFSLL